MRKGSGQEAEPTIALAELVFGAVQGYVRGRRGIQRRSRLQPRIHTLPARILLAPTGADYTVGEALRERRSVLPDQTAYLFERSRRNELALRPCRPVSRLGRAIGPRAKLRSGRIARASPATVQSGCGRPASPRSLPAGQSDIPSLIPPYSPARMGSRLPREIRVCRVEPGSLWRLVQGLV